MENSLDTLPSESREQLFAEPDPGEQSPPQAPRSGRSQKYWLLAAVVFGIVCGLLLRHLGPRGLTTAETLGQFGQLWLNALRMTIVPLVFCLMTAGVASIARTATGGAVARIAISVFLSLLVLGSLVGALAGLGLLAIWPVAPLQAAPAAALAAAPPSLLAEFVSLVPTNPIASAAQDAIAPLIVFAAFLGVAVVHIQAEFTALLLDVLNALAAALLRIIDWILRVAPFGIFFLLVPTIALAGAQGAKGLFQYAVIGALLPAIGVLLAEIVGLFSGVGAARFARAAAPSQALAATTLSSTACLPALLEAGATLQLPPAIVSAITPLAVATFRFGNVVAAVGTGLVGAALFGIHPTAAQIATAVGIGVLTNVGSVGLPGAAVVLAAWGPIYLALGAPLEALTLYIAIITVPDIMITTCNVTADLAATSLIATLVRRRAQAV